MIRMNSDLLSINQEELSFEGGLIIEQPSKDG